MKGMNEFLLDHQGILETFFEDMINVLDIKQHFKVQCIMCIDMYVSVCK